MYGATASDSWTGASCQACSTRLHERSNMAGTENMMRMALGTVQLGLPYGAANTTGMLSFRGAIGCGYRLARCGVSRLVSLGSKVLGGTACRRVLCRYVAGVGACMFTV